MALIELKMPALGEGIIEATVLKWLKQVGDTVEEEEMVLEIATDKVDSEVPSTVAGVIKELLFKENDVAPVGATIALIEGSSDSEPAAPKPMSTAVEKPAVEPDSEEAVPYVPIAQNPALQNHESSDSTRPGTIPGAPILSQRNADPGEEGDEEESTQDSGNNGFFSPLVLSIAQKEGISMEQLGGIQGTGGEGRLTKKDLLQYLQCRSISGHKKNSGTGSLRSNLDSGNGQKPVPTSYGPGTEIIEMDRMRKLIAHHMKSSQEISATVTSFAEVDVTNLVNWRGKIKKEFELREKTKITFTPLFIDCIARTIKRFPYINSSVDGDRIILKKQINIGMATALPNGNLIVPVIKNADLLNLVGLSRAVNETAEKARTNQLKPADTQEGTFTITNVGSFGSLTGTPIINQPQVAIMAIGTIKKRPVVIETPEGDTIGIRHMMILSLSYDHRIIDGAMGSKFLHEVVMEIQGWDMQKNY